MLDRLIKNLDILPEKKTYWVAGVAAVLFYANMIGLLPDTLYAQVVPWITGLLGPTVALKLMR